MTLQLLISTIDSGINNIASIILEPRDGISYLISWQHSTEFSGDIPEQLKRKDIEVVQLQCCGLSCNRNNCIKHATGDVCVICDDDCTYTHDQLNNIAITFATNPKLDIATFKAYGTKTAYPNKSFDLNNPPKNYHVTSFEIAFRRKSVQGKLQFNELFGLGAPELHCGEEEVFILDATTAGLNCKYFPAYVVTHNGETTSTKRVNQSGTLKARGAFLYKAYRRTMIPRVFLISYRLHRDYGVPFFKAVHNMFAGIAYIMKMEKNRTNP